MRIFIILLIFLKTEILACALCALMTPTAHILLNFNVSQDTLEDIEVSWIFSKNFTDLTLESYDFNSNSKLDKNELDDVNFAMLNYISNKNFLMNFEYYFYTQILLMHLPSFASFFSFSFSTLKILQARL